MPRFILLSCALAAFAQLALAEDQKEVPVAPILEDNGEALLPMLTNPTGCPGEGFVEKDAPFSGKSCVRIVPMQRYAPQIAGWEYRIREKPEPGEYRYLRFAWKCRGSSGIMLQMHDLTDWHIRYTAGANKYGWMTQFVADKPPEKWTVVNVDLFKDFGDRTIRGIALTCFDGEGGYFDHIYLGRSIADLDRIDATGLADAAPREWTAAELEEKWREAGSTDAAAAYRAFWTLVHAKGSPQFLADKLKVIQEKAGAATVKKWLADLDHDDFVTREKATASLANVVDSVATLLEEELARTTSAEVQFRIKKLLALRAEAGAGPGRTSGTSQVARAIRMLEYSPSEQAAEVLTRLSQADASDVIGKEAKEALSRRKK